MASGIYPDRISVGQVETYRIESSLPGQTFALSVDDPRAEVMPIAGSGGTRFTFHTFYPGDFLITALGDLGDTAEFRLHVEGQPSDLVEFERRLAQEIRNIVQGASPHIGPCYTTNRYPELGDEDIAVTTTPDPVGLSSMPMTNYLEIGIPTVGPVENSGKNCVRFTLVYPLAYTLGVKDTWAKDGFPYRSSSEMFIAIYLLAEQALAHKRTLGFVNVWCELLQQESVGELTNEEGEALSHYADWTLTVTVDRPQ